MSGGSSPTFTAQLVKQNFGGSSSTNIGQAFPVGGVNVMGSNPIMASASDTVNAGSGQVYYRAKISFDVGTLTYTSNAGALLITVLKR